MTSPAYAELGVLTNYSFLIGASHPDELVLTARALGHSAIGIADRNSLAGVVRAHVAAKQSGLKLVVGARLIPEDGPAFLCFPQDRAAYGRLSRLLTLGKRRAEKGQCRFTLAELKDHAQDQLLILLPPADLAAGFADLAADLAGLWRGHLWLGISQSYQGQDRRRLLRLSALAERAGLPLLAHNDVIMHQPGRKALADVLACVRQGVSVDKAGWLIAANAERHLKPPEEMARLFRDFPSAIAASQEIAARACFSLDELRHEYPDEIAPDGRAPQVVLEEATWAGAALRYPGGVPNKVRDILLHELKLIAQLDYARFFLTVADLVREARARGILCQGRGSAANSAVCYCLGITAVDPARLDLLFERFISPERNEPPDIDIDLEHERREEIIQYLYAKYGRERAGLAATVICYRSRGAVRDLGKVLGLSGDLLETIAGNIWGWSQEGVAERDLRELGLDPSESRLTLLIELMRDLVGFPRHLSQHVGGFVITKGALSELVPIENAAMEDRTVIEWDKDDLDALHILKVDVLALGMLSCIRRAFDLIQQHLGRRYELATIPPEDPAVYDMLCDADSVGVFQVESRAQMTMLPRLRPRNFYDLVIEVAIVRPGPIQGDMVHPYLRRRQGKESVSFPSKELEAVLGKTLGVPLFQEQAMRIAIVAAGFTPAEADQLRRAMATFKRVGTIHTFREKMIEGMAARGYERDFAERCFRQIEGFGTYGFPESHAASFALLVYVSAWLKRHYPAVFAAAILNSQPMGFYAPAQLVRDAREHGVEALPPDINHSAWDCTLELAASNPLAPRRFFPRKDAGLALRLGLRQIKSLSEAEALKVVAARGNGFSDALQLWRRAGVKPATLDILARADALSSFGLKRREALWVVKGFGGQAPPPLFALAGESGLGEEPPLFLPVLGEAGEVVADYSQLMLTLRAHPLSLLREDLRLAGYRPTADLTLLPDGRRLMTAGLVLVRQRPGSASGVIFATLEDEVGIANIVIWPDVFERHRRVVLGATLLGVAGRLQKEGAVIHLVADRLVDLSSWLARLEEQGDAKKAMQGAIARADEVKRPGRDQRDEDLRKAADHWPPSRDFH